MVEQIPTEVSHIPGPVLGTEQTTIFATDIYLGLEGDIDRESDKTEK